MRENRNIYQSARELKGLTQEVAAERLDLSVESLGAYEQDRRRPPDSTVLRMAQLYDHPTGYAISISSRVISLECCRRSVTNRLSAQPCG